MSRAFIMREADAIGQDLKEMAAALELECQRILEASKEATRPGDPTKGALVRPIEEWENILTYEYSRLGILVTHIKHLG